MTLPGIGEVKAQAIMQYRQEHNGFQTIDQLLQVNGIGSAIYSQIAHLVCV
jgi:competence protein ComEA